MPVIKGCKSCRPHDPCENHFRTSDDYPGGCCGPLQKFCKTCNTYTYMEKGICSMCDNDY